MPFMSLQEDFLIFNPWMKWIQTHPDIIYGPCIFTCSHRIGRRNSVVSLQRLIECHVIEERYQKISGHNEWIKFLFLEKGAFISFIMAVYQFFIRLSYIIRPTIMTSKHYLQIRCHLSQNTIKRAMQLNQAFRSLKY